MTQAEMEKKIKELEEKVKTLTDYVEQRKAQQITFPLDLPSQKIIQNL